MKIAIITWCSYPNYGTYLQAYAMQWQLRKMGHEAELLDDSTYTTNVNRPKLSILINWCKRNIKAIVLFSYRRTKKNDRIALGMFQNFRNTQLDIDKNIVPLEKLDKRYDCYVCGSDQIWAPQCLSTNGKKFFFADFTNKPKIAYAPSGLVNYPQYLRNELAQLLKGFQSLSVREALAAPLIHNLTGKEITTVTDPTLLVPMEEWTKLIKEDKDTSNNPFLLLYMLTKNKKYIQVATDYATQKGLELKIIHSIAVNHRKATTPAGPSEFLSLIKSATMVMTDSFHGTIFSIIFQRPFVTFQRFHDSENNNQNLRITNLLNIAGIANRFINEECIAAINGLEDLNFKDINKRLSPFIESSKMYIENAIRKMQHE